MSNEMTALERVQIVRHPQRPGIRDYIDALFPHFFEMKGDRLCGEDEAILGGVALYHDQPVTVIGTKRAGPCRKTCAPTSACPAPRATARRCG